MSPERQLWRWLQPQIKGWGHFVRIENEAGAGQPDVNYCIDGAEGWLELKVWPRQLERTQVIWSRQRRAAGGRVWVLCGIGTGRKRICILTTTDQYEQAQGDLEWLEDHCAWHSNVSGWEVLSQILGKEKRPDHSGPKILASAFPPFHVGRRVKKQ